MTPTEARRRIAAAIEGHVVGAVVPATFAVLRTWFDATSLDCDVCTATDGSIRLAYRCLEACGESTHTASVCVGCRFVTLSTSHAQPLWLRGELRRRALEAIREGRP